MNTLLRFPALALCSVFATAQAAEDPASTFKKIQLTNEFWAEGANFGDFNRDGKMDVVYGPWWWQGPEFKERDEIYPATKTSKLKGTETTINGFKGALSTENDYSDNFLAFTHDFNGDGWTDVLVLGFPGKEGYWLENPQGKEGHWKRHIALDVVDNESPDFTDITGDGKREIVCSSGGFLGYAVPDAADPTAKWKWHAISGKGTWQRYTHGLGVGDVNGDGRPDFLESAGWWEQPASLDGDPIWKKHDALFGKGGAQMFAYDVNKDGRQDVITSLEAHGYGVAWFEQTADGGAVGWTRHMIVGSKPEENPQKIKFSQPHALALADMNGDGRMDLVTGKRFWAHGPGGDAEPDAPAVLYWFELSGTGAETKWTGHLIDNDSGVGTQVVAGDVSGDSKPDVIVGNKKGAFILLQK